MNMKTNKKLNLIIDELTTEDKTISIGKTRISQHHYILFFNLRNSNREFERVVSFKCINSGQKLKETIKKELI